MARPLASAVRFVNSRVSTVPSSPRVLRRVSPKVNNGPCVLCQHRVRPFHSSRISSSSAASNSEPKNTAKSEDTSDTSSPLTQTPDITNHYTIFPKTLPNGPPPASPFAISVSDLRREFLALQGLLHPDKFPSGPFKDRAEALSARVNEAYRTLSDPLARAQYLLAHSHGIDVTAEDGAQTQPQDQETLMQVLEVQEAIEETEDEAPIAALKAENEQRLEECVAELGKALDQGDVDTARTECVKLRFWYNIRDCLKEWAPGKDVRLVH